MIKPIVAGNWKMNGLMTSLREAITVGKAERRSPEPTTVVICPPVTLLASLACDLSRTRIKLGAQDCHAVEAGAHTGDVSAKMLMDAGATTVIVGHSERRSDHAELSRDVRAKADAALAAGLTAIICIGETAGERNIGRTLNVIERQLSHSLPDGSTASNTIVAYEPVWAIGSGLTPSTTDIATVHNSIRGQLQAKFGSGARIPILYGGSVKPTNAKELLSIPNVNGALVGGASLRADEFLGIIHVCDEIYADSD
ncbi:MAG: triose-phosphate isomerase [Hyphomicrobiaceae bacterium]